MNLLKTKKNINGKKAVLDRLPAIIESLQDKGYKASDIGIIVRDGKEGCQVLNALIDLWHCILNRRMITRYNFNAVSNDSLLLSNSPVIIFLIAVISVANDPHDYISRAIMLRFYLLAIGNENAEKVSLLKDNLIEGSRLIFLMVMNI